MYVDAVNLESSRSRARFLNELSERAAGAGIPFDRGRADECLMNYAHTVQQQVGGGSSVYQSLGGAAQEGLLEHAGIEVLGELPDQSILCWIPATQKRWLIKNPGKWSAEEMLQALGSQAAGSLWLGEGQRLPGQFAPADLRRAVAMAAADAPRLGARPLSGQGIWPCDGRLLVIDGAQAHLYDGQRFEPVNHPQLGNRIIDFNADKRWGEGIIDATLAMTSETAAGVLQQIEEILRRWNWTHVADPQVAAALVAATDVQAIWSWRPSVSVTGASDSGKTTLLQEVLVPMLGELVIAADRSTEAGLRQAIGCDAMPVVIDEFDKYRQRQLVLELFRTSSRGGTILRGTQDQNGLRFEVHHIGWFAAIESGDIWGADRNRFIRLELRPPASRGSLVLPAPEELRQLGRQLAAAALWAAPTATRLAESLRAVRIPGLPGRLVESFSVPAAMAAVFCHGRDVDCSTAADVLRAMLAERTGLVGQGERDEIQLLRDILATNIRVAEHNVTGGTVYVQRSVGQLLSPQDRVAPYAFAHSISRDNLSTLEAKGIALVQPRGAGRERLFLAHEMVRRELLADTRWSGTCIDQVLQRIRGAEREQQRCGGLRPYGISLPWPECLNDTNGEDTEGDSANHNGAGI